MYETACFAVLSGLGCILLRTRPGLSRVSAAALAAPMAGSVLLCTGVMLLAVVGVASPRAFIGVSLCTAVIGCVWRRDHLSAPVVRDSALCASVIFGLGLASQELVPVRVTPDSLQYLSLSGLFVQHGGLDLIDEQNILYRLATTGILHAVGDIDDRIYGLTVMPAIGLSGFLLMAALIWEEAQGAEISRRGALALATLVAGYALTTFQGIYAVFYINSHGVVMTAFLIMVVGGYRAVGGGTDWLLPIAMAGPLIVVGRTEGALLVALAALPLLTQPGPLRTRHRTLIVLPSAVIAVVWFGGVVAPRVTLTLSPMDPVLGPMAITSGLVALGLFWGWPKLRPLLRHAPVAAVVGLLLLCVLGSIRTPEILTASLGATARNVTETGNWALTWPFLATLFIGLTLTKPPPDFMLCLPVTGFFVLLGFLPFARGYAYRIGPGDSGSRVLVHVLLVVVFMLVASALKAAMPSGRWELRNGQPGLQEEAL